MEHSIQKYASSITVLRCNFSRNALLLLCSVEDGQGELLVLLSPVSVLQLLGVIYQQAFPELWASLWMRPWGFRACGQPMALVSVELNIGLHPVASLVGKLNPWLQAERNQGRQLKWISLGFPGAWLHAQLSPTACGRSRSPGKPWMSSSCEPFSMHPQPSSASWPLSSVVCAWQGDGKGPLEPGHLNLAILTVKGEPNTLLSPTVFKTLTERERILLLAFVFES